jgi:hypothetical protein
VEAKGHRLYRRIAVASAAVCGGAGGVRGAGARRTGARARVTSEGQIIHVPQIAPILHN